MKKKEQSLEELLEQTERMDKLAIILSMIALATGLAAIVIKVLF